MKTALGIDFGTSNSTVGYVTATGPRLIPLEAGRVTLPSALFYDFDERKTLFGRGAIAAYTDQCNGRLLRALKSILGNSLIFERTKLGRESLSFMEIIGTFLAHLKKQSETALGCEIESVVLGRPVWFVDDDPAADRQAQNQLEQAARAQGFKQISFQYEPVAAALDYEQTIAREELTLIADIGGGTSDFSIIRLSPEGRGRADRKMDILANTGTHVGGTDLDKQLSLKQVMPHLGFHTPQRARPELDLPTSIYFDLATWHRIVFLYNQKTRTLLRDMQNAAARPDLVERLACLVEERNGHRLAGDVERGKIDLSAQDKASLHLDYIEAGLEIELDQKIFQQAIERERNKIKASLESCLKQAGVSAMQIDTLFLTGGTTAVPLIAQTCRACVPAARLVEGDKLGSVGVGLALESARRYGR